MKTIVVKTKKVVSQDQNMMPVFEEIEQKISPELTFNKFCKYLPNQQYVEAKVIRVLKSTEVLKKLPDGKEVGEMKSKEVDEVDKYQSMVDKALTPQEETTDYKVLAEKQAKLLKEMQERLTALEQKPKATRTRQPKDETKVEPKQEK